MWGPRQFEPCVSPYRLHIGYLYVTYVLFLREQQEIPMSNRVTVMQWAEMENWGHIWSGESDFLLQRVRI